MAKDLKRCKAATSQWSEYFFKLCEPQSHGAQPPQVASSQNSVHPAQTVSTKREAYNRGRYHQESSSQLITLQSQIFPVKKSNLQSSDLVGLVAKSSVFTFRISSIFQSSFFTRANLLTSLKPGYTPTTPKVIFIWRC